MTVQNAENVVVGVISLVSNVSIRHRAYDFLFNFSRMYAVILYCFRDIVSYLSKIANCNLPHLHLASLLGVTRWNFAKIFSKGKRKNWVSDRSCILVI